MINFDSFLRFQRTLQILPRDPVRPGLVPFVANPNQMKAHRAYQKQLSSGNPLRVICVKSRRIGFSRDCLSIGMAHLLSTPGASGTVAAHLSPTAEELFLQVRDWYQRFPVNLGKPTKKELRFPHRSGRSTLTWSTAKNAIGGRGATRSWLMLSEAAYVEVDAFNALLSTVSKKDPNSIIQIESSANGKSGTGEAFYRLWTEAWESSASGNFSSFVPVFLGWLEDPDCVRSASEAPDAPRTDLERELMKDFHATKGQIAWMRDTSTTFCNGLEDVFCQEYPWCPDVAFLSSGSPAFTRGEIRYATATVGEARVLFQGRLFGSEGEYAPIASRSGPWKVFQHPQPRHYYYVGGDSARGDEGYDYTTACIWDGQTGEQVAALKGYIRPDDFAAELNAAGRLYSHGSSPAKLLIEITGHTGGITQSILRDRFRYANLYFWKGARNDRPKGKSGMGSLGWEMTENSRKRALEQFRTDLTAGRPKVRDREFLEQMEIAQRGGGGTYDWRIERDHDDVFTAGILGWICVSDFPPPGDPAPSKFSADFSSRQQRVIHAIETEESGFGFLVMTDRHQRLTRAKAASAERDRRIAALRRIGGFG